MATKQVLSKECADYCKNNITNNNYNDSASGKRLTSDIHMTWYSFWTGDRHTCIVIVHMILKHKGHIVFDVQD